MRLNILKILELRKPEVFLIVQFFMLRIKNPRIYKSTMRNAMHFELLITIL